MTPIKLHYSEPLIRHAVKAFWWRSTGWTYVAAVMLVLVAFCSAVWKGDRSWWVGVAGAVLGLAVLVAAMLYVVHYRGSLTRFHRMRTPEATLELGDDRFRVSSDVGASEMEWSTVTEVWRFPDFWLLFFSRAQFMTLPTADLSPEACAFILARVAAHQAKIV